MPNDDYLDEMERHCHEAIALLRQSFEEAAKPYYERLSKIASMRPIPIQLTITMEEARALGFFDGPPMTINEAPAHERK